MFIARTEIPLFRCAAIGMKKVGQFKSGLISMSLPYLNSQKRRNHY